MSHVTNMLAMFCDAESFNQDLSNWDVSRVTDMQLMFIEADSFRQTLCGAAWVNSTATKDKMFTLSPGSISDTVCGTWMFWYLFLELLNEYFFLLNLLSPPHVHIVTPKHSSTPTLIPERRPHLPTRAHSHTHTHTHTHTYTLLTLLSVFSPHSRDELKRAVDDCEQLTKPDHVSKKKKVHRFV